MDSRQTRNILEACLLVAGKPMNLGQLEALFESDIDRPDRNEIKAALASLQDDYEGRGIELVEVASGWRLQSRASMEHWVTRLFHEKTPRYSRALLETLVLIAYRQPITRGEIEEVRGVAVSSNIIKTLQEREWVKEIGYKDVPGKPALWGTTRQFLDYFNLKRLDELPTLAEARDLEEIDAALAAEIGIVDGASDGIAANDGAEVGEGFTHSAGNDGSDDSDSSGDASSEGASEKLRDGASEGASEASADDSGSEPAIQDDPASANQLSALADGLPGAELRTNSQELSALVQSFLGRSSLDVDVEQPDDLQQPQDLQQPGTVSHEHAAHDDVGSGDEQRGAGDSVVQEASLPSVQSESDPESGIGADSEIVSAHDLVIEAWRPPQSRTGAKPDQNGALSLSDTTDVSAAATVSSDSESPPDDEGSQTPADEPHDAQTRLRQAIDDFADEHRQELEARRDFEARTRGPLGRPPGNAPDKVAGAGLDVEQEQMEAPQAHRDVSGTTSPVFGRRILATVMGEAGSAQSSRLTTSLYGVSGIVESELHADTDKGLGTSPEDARPEPTLESAPGMTAEPIVATTAQPSEGPVTETTPEYSPESEREPEPESVPESTVGVDAEQLVVRVEHDSDSEP